MNGKDNYQRIIKKWQDNYLKKFALLLFPRYFSSQFLKTLILWPLFLMDEVHLFQGSSHFEEAVYFLPFSIQFPEFPGTHFIDLGRMKGWVTLGATHWFWTRDPWIGNPAPYPIGQCSITKMHSKLVMQKFLKLFTNQKLISHHKETNQLIYRTYKMTS